MILIKKKKSSKMIRCFYFVDINLFITEINILCVYKSLMNNNMYFVNKDNF